MAKATDQDRARVLDEIAEAGGLKPGVAREVARSTGVPEAEVYGAGSFFHLLAEPDVDVRVCQGLSCQMAGAEDVLAAAKASGLRAEGCQCLAACDQPPAVLRSRRVLPGARRAQSVTDRWSCARPRRRVGGADEGDERT